MTIARIWHGITLTTDADRYLRYLDQSVIPSYQIAEGNEGLFFMKECQGELMHFILLSFWASVEALKKFAGTDAEVVSPAPEERSLLVAFESRARHYKVVRALNNIPKDLQELRVYD